MESRSLVACAGCQAAATGGSFRAAAEAAGRVRQEVSAGCGELTARSNAGWPRSVSSVAVAARWSVLGTCKTAALNLFSFILFFYGRPTNRVQSRGKRSLPLRKRRVKSQSCKNEDKITIGLHSRGKITKFPFYI